MVPKAVRTLAQYEEVPLIVLFQLRDEEKIERRAKVEFDVNDLEEETGRSENQECKPALTHELFQTLHQTKQELLAKDPILVASESSSPKCSISTRMLNHQCTQPT